MPPVNKEPVSVVPIDRFEAARHALAAINSQLFYKETSKATWQMLAEKFKLVSSDLNKPLIFHYMTEIAAQDVGGVDVDVIREARQQIS